MTDNPETIYDPEYIKSLFDKMSKTYGLANYISSFGFTERWRAACLNNLPSIAPNSVGYDLMTGMGEAWGHILPKLNAEGKLIAVDISPVMMQKAALHREKVRNRAVEMVQCDVLNNHFESNSADFVISTFGLKTFNDFQTRVLAREVNRLLKPGGSFSFVEISAPKGWILHGLYLFYLKKIIPLIGKLFLNSADEYRMLGVYCQKFENCQKFATYLMNEGLDVTYKSYFFGCATGVVGRKTKK
ncbi:class I SAM-dependent methyltransferase [Larkinella humicola]|uniref:Methyltransferase domain-containing protein n=1 Tax=Larkinella humicola TaxID=2607654 RepID=A0A5N1JLE6_9BACT|nr:class I SAM-dependent methyltransferase [Larkinella humicola]KAA9357004.1 methyltransferase domain-containing protein [Larkinella humicola]